MPKRTRQPASRTQNDDGALFDGARELQVIQFSPPDPMPELDIDAFVTTLCLDAIERRRRDRAAETWSVWLAVDQPSVGGFTSWVGVDATSASGLALAIDGELTEHGCTTRRGSAAIGTAGMRPLFRARSDGFDLPERAAQSVIDVCAGLAVTHVPFRISLTELWKRDLLARLMMGDPAAPLLDLPYYRDDPAAAFVLGRVDMQMFMRLPDGTVIAAARPSDTPPVVLTFELSPARMLELLTLLDADARQSIATRLTGPTPVKLPAGTCVVGVEAHADAPDQNNSCSYIVHSLFTPVPGFMEVRF